MDEYLENRFGYLRELSRDEKLNMIEVLETDILNAREMLKVKNINGDNRNDLYNDIAYERDKLAYLKSIIDERQL